jgi:hypothetical protein
MVTIILCTVAFIAGAILNNPDNRKRLVEMLKNAFDNKSKE